MVWAARSKVCAVSRYSCLVVRSGTSWSPHAVLWQLVEGDLEPAHPSAVAFPASFEAIDALLGTKRGSPRVMPDETKLALTNCGSRGSAKSMTFGAVGEWRFLLVFIVAVRRSSFFHRRTS